MTFMLLYLTMREIKLDCLRKHINPSAESGNDQWILLWAMNRLLTKGQRRIPLKKS